MQIIPVKVNDRNMGKRLENGTYSGLVGKVQKNEILVIPRISPFPDNLSVLESIVPVWANRLFFFLFSLLKLKRCLFLKILISTKFFSLNFNFKRIIYVHLHLIF